MKRFLVVAALLLAFAGARAEGPDDQYVRIYNLIQDADKLSEDGQASAALPKYLEAQSALQRLQKAYTDWNPPMINFRLQYLATKIAESSARGPAPMTNAPGNLPAKPASASGTGPAQTVQTTPSDLEARLGALTDQARQLQADKAVLEAKLKEALAVQPATIDPRELAKAEEKIRSLQKENDLLKVSLDQERSKPAPAPDTRALEEARQASADANRKLADQAKTANALAKERDALQTRLASLSPSTPGAADLETTRKALQEATLKLDEQSKLAAALGQEKETLQARVKTLAADAEAAAALRTENELLKKQVADLKAAPPPVDKLEEANRKLAQAQAQVAALQSDKEMLRLEKISLENRVKLSSPPPAPAAAPAAPPKAAEVGRIKLLEKERDDLQKQLAAANKELSSRKNKAAAARVAELQKQLALLRARLEVYEARQVPYTGEELALFKQPDTGLPRAERKPGNREARELPAGTVELVAEAQRFFANRQFDKAEQKYLEVLQRDNKSVPALADLAAIEMELGHLDAAEINIKQAVALAPDNPYALFVLGRLKLHQKKIDDAIDALSQAAKLDPQDAQAQNFLGLALSEKGLRGPSETALRKAVQLDPGYANAHNNLAVVYVTQKPPLLELARWHYQKALASGNPRNPDLEKLLESQKPSGNAP